MGEITLVRHGQANSQATDEASYDRLSELGWEQGRLLGAYFETSGQQFDHVYCGTLRRHIETAKAAGFEAPKQDARLNELDYFNLGAALESTHGVPFPGPDDFAAHIPQVLEAWHKAEIMGVESFAAFEARVTGVLQEAARPGARVLCVTSGGVIGMVMRHLLRLDPARMAHVMLPIFNTSIHRVSVRDHGAILAGFNATPHLDAPDQIHKKTNF